MIWNWYENVVYRRLSRFTSRMCEGAVLLNRSTAKALDLTFPPGLLAGDRIAHGRRDDRNRPRLPLEGSGRRGPARQY